MSEQRRRSQVLEIARWEFLRFFKWRDLILSVVLVGGVGLVGYGFAYWQEKTTSQVDLAVIAPVAIPLPEERFALEAHEPEAESRLREAVMRGDLDGLLIVEAEGGRLVVRKDPTWKGWVVGAAQSAIQGQRLTALGVDLEALARALAPVEIEVELTAGTGGAGARTLALVLAIAMLLTVTTGLGYLFMGITGEKQDRVSEQLFSIASARALIDGKLLAVAGLAVINVVEMAGFGLIGYEIFNRGGVARLLSSFAGVGPSEALTLVAFTVAGCAFWFSVCAALFATISDPNSSARTNTLVLPLISMSAAFLGLGDPDSVLMQVLGWVPITSMTVMPERAILSHVPSWQILGSLALLVASIALVRRGAARIYEAGMLMYGKEPTFAEMLRWVRAAGGTR